MPVVQRKGVDLGNHELHREASQDGPRCAGLALFVQYKDEILGGKGEIVLGPDGTPTFVPAPGMAERVTNRTLTWVLPVLAAIVGLWGVNRLYWAWRWSKLSHAVKTARVVESNAGRGK